MWLESEAIFEFLVVLFDEGFEVIEFFLYFCVMVDLQGSFEGLQGKCLNRGEKWS